MEKLVLGTVLAVLACGMPRLVMAETPSTSDPIPADSPSTPGTESPSPGTESPSPGTAMPAPDARPPAESPRRADVEILSFLQNASAEEIEMGRLAQERGKSRAVQKYGKMLVDDHTKAREELTELLRQEHLSLTSTGSPGLPGSASDYGMADGRDGPGTHADGDARSLANLSGEAFDRAFLDQMVTRHAEAIRQINQAQRKVQDKEVSDFLDDQLDVLEKHHDKAARLQESGS